MSIELKDIHKRYGSFTALANINLDIAEGELVALLGPSGSGKTTLLRIIAGLEVPDRGAVLLNGEDLTRYGAAQRGIGFVFQHYALFRHMTVFENVAFGLRVQPRGGRPTHAEIRERVQELLHLVQLGSYARMYPAQLSGGQRQRIALARALAVKPSVLLLDEPFSALDAKVRKDLRNWLRRIHDELHVTTVLVTHDQEEALEVADRVVILNSGSVEQIGSPQSIYDRPASPFVYRFLGNVNLFHNRLLEYLLPNENKEARPAESQPVIGFVRPHELDVFRKKPGGEPSLEAKVYRIHTLGPIVRLELRFSSNDELVTAEISKKQFEELSLLLGDEIFVRPHAIRLFDTQDVDETVLEHGAGI